MAHYACTLLLPHQLQHDHPALDRQRPVLLVEAAPFFGPRIHKQKLVLHRASMRARAEELRAAGYEVAYLQAASHAADEASLDVTAVIRQLAGRGVRELHLADPTEQGLLAAIRSAAHESDMRLDISENPNFLCSRAEVGELLGGDKDYFMASFYRRQRIRLGILLENGDKPLGGKWSFDAENRKKLPRGYEAPRAWTARANAWTDEAISYVEKHFPVAPGRAGSFVYPVTRSQALEAFEDFLERRFDAYGIYQDAIASGRRFLHHAVITPALNIGLLSPAEVLDLALARHARRAVPTNSLEGFVRQVAGWREFVRGVYQLEGERQRSANFFGFSRGLPPGWERADTGIAPVDDCLRKLEDSGYLHHIERLMVLGNFLLLSETDPKVVCSWFMHHFIDAYDWVMVPNVYGMSQYADGGLITTKPYVSGSNYLRKMSDHPVGEWCEIWDALYWRFIGKHREQFAANPRMTMMLRQLDKMDPSRYEDLMRRAEGYLSAH